MRLFRFGSPGAELPGAFDENGIARDISSLVDDHAGFAWTPRQLSALRQLDLSRLPRVADGQRLGPCVAGTRNFIAVGLNYADHAAESGATVPIEPLLFNKAPSCIVGPDDNIVIPRGSTQMDWEVELAVVIGKQSSYLEQSEVAGAIAGYCICHDVSERSFQLERSGQWTKGKGCPTFGPLGPWLVTPDAIGDVQSLSMWLDVNGERMQTGSTATMVFGVQFLVAYISQFMTLEPGDVITTGTPPGVGMGREPAPRYLQPGDVVTLGIDGLGTQRQTVLAWESSRQPHRNQA